MPYATADDVIKRYNPINTMIGTGSMQVSTTDIASVYVQDAESIINAFLARRYQIPLSNEPLLTDLASDIAVYRILSDRAPRMPDFMEKRYTNAMSMLTMLAEGIMQLTTSSGVITNSGGDNFAWSNVIDPGQNGPVFKPVESLPPFEVRSQDRFTY